ncbi:MAG: hypothetical protein OES57_08345 [Acidimicrobiia bacterium]|nr:hypothetical protein [Acidimicrobiia bacterium]
MLSAVTPRNDAVSGAIVVLGSLVAAGAVAVVVLALAWAVVDAAVWASSSPELVHAPATKAIAHIVVSERLISFPDGRA